MALTQLSYSRPGAVLTELEERVSISKAVIYEAIVEAVEELVFPDLSLSARRLLI